VLRSNSVCQMSVQNITQTPKTSFHIPSLPSPNTHSAGDAPGLVQARQVLNHWATTQAWYSFLILSSLPLWLWLPSNLSLLSLGKLADLLSHGTHILSLKSMLSPMLEDYILDYRYLCFLRICTGMTPGTSSSPHLSWILCTSPMLTRVPC
jgi:hypothetical protein